MARGSSFWPACSMSRNSSVSARGPRICFEIWILNLEFPWNLVLGIWCFAPKRIAALLLGLLVFSPPFLSAQPPQPASDEWPLETIRLKDNRSLRGLVQSQRDGEIEFIEIVRPPGKPMFGILHPFQADEVESLTMLPPPEHDTLSRRFEQFRHRAMIEAGRMESLEFEAIERAEQKWLVYRGPWFTLESTADDETTRRCVVRIEQTFRAFRMLWPPRIYDARNLRVVLLGSMDEYRTYLGTYGLEIENPAYFSLAQNQIVAGSDLSQYSSELARVRAQNEATRQSYLELGKELPARLSELARELRTRGYDRNEIRDELNARRAAWQTELKAMERKLAEINRRNDARFADVTAEMFRRLSHEAFHAYLENYLYPHERHDFPRWLNEGLAQIFENAQLEAGALRVDAPPPDLLGSLQAHLQQEEGPLLEPFIRNEDAQFAPQHGRREVDRHYVYAWGLAYYLSFEHHLLRGDRLDDFVAPVHQRTARETVARFEALTGTKLPEFEVQWRTAMLQLKPPR